MFQKAQRTQSKLKIALTGPSGSGKTYSALLLATGLGGKIAVIDTENGSASLYADRFDFEVLNIRPPFTTEKFIKALDIASKAGFQVVIMDSITHAWSGEGGLLEQKEQLDARGKGNSYTNWGTITKKHEAFKSAFLQSPIHVICTMRSKTEYVLVENEKGKQAPKKVGMAPVQRDGMEYEFTTVFDIAMNHEAEVSKDRTGLFPADGFFKISEDTGKLLAQWIGSAKALPPPAPKVQAPVVPTKPNEQDPDIDGFLGHDIDSATDPGFDHDPGPPPEMNYDEPIASPPKLEEPTVLSKAQLARINQSDVIVAYGKGLSGRRFKQCEPTDLLKLFEWLVKSGKDKVDKDAARFVKDYKYVALGIGDEPHGY